MNNYKEKEEYMGHLKLNKNKIIDPYCYYPDDYYEESNNKTSNSKCKYDYEHANRAVYRLVKNNYRTNNKEILKGFVLEQENFIEDCQRRKKRNILILDFQIELRKNKKFIKLTGVDIFTSTIVNLVDTNGSLYGLHSYQEELLELKINMVIQAEFKLHGNYKNENTLRFVSSIKILGESDFFKLDIKYKLIYPGRTGIIHRFKDVLNYCESYKNAERYFLVYFKRTNIYLYHDTLQIKLDKYFVDINDYNIKNWNDDVNVYSGYILLHVLINQEGSTKIYADRMYGISMNKNKEYRESLYHFYNFDHGFRMRLEDYFEDDLYYENKKLNDNKYNMHKKRETKMYEQLDCYDDNFALEYNYCMPAMKYKDDKIEFISGVIEQPDNDYRFYNSKIDHSIREEKLSAHKMFDDEQLKLFEKDVDEDDQDDPIKFIIRELIEQRDIDYDFLISKIDHLLKEEKQSVHKTFDDEQLKLLEQFMRELIIYKY